MLVWEPRPASVRVFEPSGAFVRLFAREGGGPGEVRDARWLGAVADTIFVFDGTQRRITRFDLNGTMRSTAPFQVSDGAETFSVIGRWRSGAFALQSYDRGFSGRGPDGSRRDSVWVAVSDGTGGALRRLARVAGAVTFTQHIGRSGVAVGPLPFGAETLLAMGQDVLWIGDTATPSVLGYDSQGHITYRLSVPFRSQAVLASLAATRQTRELDETRVPQVRSYIEAKYSTLPKSTPYYSGLSAAPDGTVWITGYSPNEAVGATVAVLTPEGVQRATLQLPPRFRVAQVGTNVVTGVYRDADGVEYVHVYELHRK